MSGDAFCCGGVTAGKDGGVCARIGSFAAVVASGLVVVLMLRGMNGPLIGASDIVRDNLRTLIRASDDIATHRLLGRSATHTEEAPSTIANGPPELPDIIIQQGKPRTGTSGTFVRRAYVRACTLLTRPLAHARTHLQFNTRYCAQSQTCCTKERGTLVATFFGAFRKSRTPSGTRS